MQSDGATPWRVPTLADSPSEQLSLTRGARDNGHLIPCPCCGVRCAADLLVDIRALPASISDALGWTGRGYACDGCRETAHRTGQLTHEALCLSHGAPSDVLARARAYDAWRLTTLSDEARAAIGRQGPSVPPNPSPLP